MTDHLVPDWDPRAPSVQHDQLRAYDEMRERCPVAYSDFLEWSLFRHRDVVNVVGDPATYSSASKHLAIPNGMDPPEHTKYRRVLEPYFEHQPMAAFEPTCHRIAGDLVGGLLARDGVGTLEFVADFAQPFALRSLCAFLGWPQEMWEKLGGWTHGNQEVAFSQNREAGAALARELAEYVEQAIQLR